MTFSSCTSETSYYDTLDETQAAFLFTGTTQGIQALLGPAYSKLTQELQMPINAGSNPPNLNGNYPLFEQETIANIFDPNVVPWISDNRFIHINLINQDNSNLTIDYQGFFMDAGADGQPLGGDDSVVLTSRPNHYE